MTSTTPFSKIKYNTTNCFPLIWDKLFIAAYPNGVKMKGEYYGET